MSEETVAALPVPANDNVRLRGPGGRFLKAEGTPKRAVRRKAKAKIKRTRWTAKAEAAFLERLAEHGNVALAAREAKLSDTSVYRMRAKSEAFRGKWALALREGFAKLETLMLERALAGVDKPVWHGGKQVGTVHQFDDRLCLALLRAHRDTVHGVKPMTSDISDEEMRAAIAERLRVMNLNMGGEG